MFSTDTFSNRLLVFIGGIALGCIVFFSVGFTLGTSALQLRVKVTPTPSVREVFATPIPDAATRVTKKPFGLYVSPEDSPVSPERFTGYHVGVDFETTPEEQALEVPFFAICTGPLLEKKTATGYGGVVTQACSFGGRSISVIYGHIQLSSVAVAVNEQILTGQKIGVLGKGFTSQTGGERKHLHVGVYVGPSSTIRGYEPTPGALSSWMNVVDYFR